MNDVQRANGGSVHRAQHNNQSVDLSTDQAVESAALAGATAIQKLVAERNGLRTQLVAQEQETAAYRAINNDLRRRLLLVHQHYVELATGIVGNLERFDGTLREIAHEAHNTQDPHRAEDGQESQKPWDGPVPASLVRAPNEAANGAQPNGSAPAKR